MKKVALYCRVSLSNGSQTNENQKIRLIEYAEKNSLSYDLYQETESTRRTRPVKQALLSRLRNKEYNAVVVYKLDRWARSSTELILDITELINKGIGFKSISDNLDFSSPAGRLQFHILSAFAEFERELIRQRTICSLQRLKANGYIFKGRPKGSKDLKKRKTTGYYEREARKREMSQFKKVVPSNNW
ncbi:MAG: recombinase family protein [Candidatus Methanofastidiosa archaeon]|nr:recombinase family protein [Candidatus Methanofastidiosa archaeon]